jgi:cob(I)alamin adenosyltransferase
MGKGLIILNTGNGKGKTTSALGQIFRALGHNWKICMIQFIKRKENLGETKTAKKFSKQLEFHFKGKGYIFSSKDKPKHIKSAKDAWKFAKEKIFSDKYDLIVLDELTYLIKYKFIEENEIISVLKNKPERLNIIITGRYASKGLIETADLVSKIYNIKHPFQKGIKAQKGIEY